MTSLLGAVCTPGLFAVAALAQLNRGSITATITDNSGAVVPNVRVTIRNVATGAEHAILANDRISRQAI